MSEDFNQDKWLFESLAEIVGVEPVKEHKLLTYRRCFNNLYEKATYEQRLAVIRKTRLAQLYPDEIEEMVRTHTEANQMLPATRVNRGEDWEYYFMPRDDENGEKANS